jgi:uncharacterized protein DUF2188
MTVSNLDRWLAPSPPVAVDDLAQAREPAGGAAAPDRDLRTVVRTHDGLWRIVSPEAIRASAVCDTRREAESRAREILLNRGGGEMRVQDADGTVLGVETVQPVTHEPRRLYRNPRISYRR